MDTKQMVNRPGQCMHYGITRLHCTLMVNAYTVQYTTFRMSKHNRHHILGKGSLLICVYTVGLALIVLYPVCCLLSLCNGLPLCRSHFCVHTVCFYYVFFSFSLSSPFSSPFLNALCKTASENANFQTFAEIFPFHFFSPVTSSFCWILTEMQ